MKITSEEEIDLENFDAWQGGKDRLNELIKIGTVKKAQQEIEELFPDGIDDGQLNDWLWFDVEDQHPEWFNDNWDEMQEVISKIENRDDPWFVTDGNLNVILTYETDDDDARVFKLEAELRGNGNAYLGGEEIDYDFGKSLEENMADSKIELMQSGYYEKIPDEFEYVEDFPTWAIVYCMYDDSSGMSDDDKKLVDEWMEENGYGELVNAFEETKNDFNKYPAFGLACETETVVMRKKKEDNNV
jgi:hypothetical protein